MADVNPQTFEAAKDALVRLINAPASRPLTFLFREHRIIFPPSDRDEENPEYPKNPWNETRAAYFFLQKLDFLLNPLLTEIVHVERDDIDAHFVFVSRYFEYLTWALRLGLKTTYGIEPNYEPLYRASRAPLTDYFQKSSAEKRDIKGFAEQVYLAIGKMRSEHFPDEIIVKPSKETKVFFDAIETFIAEYKRAIEAAALDTKIAVEDIKRKFEQPEVSFDVDTSILSFRGKSIQISKTKNSDPHYLLAVVFKDKTKTWAFDEIWDDSYFKGRNPEYDPKTDWRKIYNAAYAVNEKVAKATAINNFLSTSKTAVSINKTYL